MSRADAAIRVESVQQQQQHIGISAAGSSSSGLCRQLVEMQGRPAAAALLCSPLSIHPSHTHSFRCRCYRLPQPNRQQCGHMQCMLPACHTARSQFAAV